jgi:hypothetical protein
MNKKQITVSLIFLAGLSLISMACGLTDVFSNYVVERGQEVEKQVELTLTALADEETLQTDGTATPQPLDKPTEDARLDMGQISGSLAYPSEILPPQRIVAFEANDPSNYYVTEVRSGGTYTIEVPPSTYYVLAYLISPQDLGATPGLAGAYSAAVPCGLTVDCDDHSLIPVRVTPGETVDGIDPVDWYLPPDQISAWPSDPTKAESGTIQGGLGYPSEYIPPMRVVAFDTTSQDYYYVDTQRNQNAYEMTGIPPGTYQVVAFVREEGPDLAGGYSHFVTCGMHVDCEDHNLIDVIVYAGEVTQGVDPVDFYIQPAAVGWPENPIE